MTPDMPKMPKPDEDTKAFFQSVVPEHPEVRIRPMFGQLSAFVKGNMFMGIFGSDVFVRLGDADREKAMNAGGGAFEPMKGRPMREYVVLPSAWRKDAEKVRTWATRSLEWAEQLPAKQANKPAAKQAKKPKRAHT
jgi:TfoX/Sxy family transcriptional regulator of competence genes